MSRVRRVVLCTLSAATALTACGPSLSPSDQAGAGAREHVATYEPVGEGGDAASFDGFLRIEDGCVVLESLDGQRVLPRFAAGEVGWEVGALEYQGRTYHDGDGISLGGGYSDYRRGLGPTLPVACRDLALDAILTVAQR